MKKPHRMLDGRQGSGENWDTHVLRGLPSSPRIALAGTAPSREGIFLRWNVRRDYTRSEPIKLADGG